MVGTMDIMVMVGIMVGIMVTMVMAGDIIAGTMDLGITMDTM
jgi:hypothetical protein